MALIQWAAIVLGAGMTPAEFRATWDDWKAELDGYRLVQPRYGQAREGHAAMVWVLEPFSKTKHVKLDHPEASPGDVVQVMKLNILRKFVTGIYDYSLMTSVFAPVTFGTSFADGRPLKVAFSGQEWCGTVFEQLDVRGDALRAQWHSYFESESDGVEERTLPGNALLEDELWYRLRELTQPLQSGTYPFLPSLQAVRLSHTQMVLGTSTIRRGVSDERIRTPAGEYTTVRWDLQLTWGPNGRQKQSRTVWVEAGQPHRIIAWEGDVPSWNGNEPVRERGELAGAIRDTYWQHNRLADQNLREKLGF